MMNAASVMLYAIQGAMNIQEQHLPRAVDLVQL